MKGIFVRLLLQTEMVCKTSIKFNFLFKIQSNQFRHDSRLRYEGPFNSLTLNIHMLQLIWRPDIYIVNGKGSYVHEITRPNKFLRIYQNGEGM